jgi:hypothetical protein
MNNDETNFFANFQNHSQQAQQSFNIEEHMDPLRIKVQCDGFLGTELPKEASKLRPNSMFFLKGVNKLYAVRCTIDTIDEFNECISVRQGDYEWVEVLYDISTKKHSHGEVAYTEKSRTQYPTSELNDVDDMLNNIYTRFVYTDSESMRFVKSLADPHSTTPVIEAIEAYTQAKFTEEFSKEFTGDGKERHIYNLVNGLRHILFYSYILHF